MYQRHQDQKEIRGSVVERPAIRFITNEASNPQSNGGPAVPNPQLVTKNRRNPEPRKPRKPSCSPPHVSRPPQRLPLGHKPRSPASRRASLVGALPGRPANRALGQNRLRPSGPLRHRRPLGRSSCGGSPTEHAGHFYDCRQNSKIIDHPNVAAAGHPEDGEIVSVWRGDRIDSRSPTLVPKRCRVTLQVYV